MKKIVLIALLFATALLSGCAHQIQINPKTTEFVESNRKVDAVVGYHISDTDRIKKVTTPGGGGDKVSYVPYEDTETVLYTVLSNKFKEVYLVKDLENASFIKENGIELIFVPVITTNSSSSSLLTWPPTTFTIELAVKAIDHSGSMVWEKSVSAEGKAEFDEFKGDFSLAARRATESAFLQLAKELEDADVINETVGK